MGSFSKKSNDKLHGVHPKLVDLCNIVIKNSPNDFCIVQGARSQSYQDDLYTQGRTTDEVRKAGITDRPGRPDMQIVTKTRNSDHIPRDGFAHAIDFALGSADNPKWTPTDDFVKIAKLFKKYAAELGLDIDCGADWKFKDFGHIALKG